MQGILSTRGSFLTQHPYPLASLTRATYCTTLNYTNVKFAKQNNLNQQKRKGLTWPIVVSRDTQPSHWSAAFIFWTVHEMRLFTVSTDSTVSLAEGRLFTSIWNATVSRDPHTLGCDTVLWSLLPLDPSGAIANPDGRSATYAESPPFMTKCMAGMSTGAYTTSDPDASVHVSCRISMLLWFELIAWKKKWKKNKLENRKRNIIRFFVLSFSSRSVWELVKPWYHYFFFPSNLIYFGKIWR